MNMESTNKNQDHCSLPIAQTSFTMEQLNSILQKNNTALIEALKNTIHDEIQRAISQLKTELTQKTENLHIEINKLQNEMLLITQKTELLQQKHNKLREEYNLLEINIQNQKQPSIDIHTKKSKSEQLRKNNSTTWSNGKLL